MNLFYYNLKMITKKTVLLIVFLFNVLQSTVAQDFSKCAYDAFVITRMVEKHHLQSKELNETFSKNVFVLLLDKLDDEKFIFSQEEISILNTFKSTLHLEITDKKTQFLNVIYNLYNKKINQLDSLISVISNSKINLTTIEKITALEDSTFPKNIDVQKNLLYKLIKEEIINEIANLAVTRKMDKLPSNKFIDSIESILRKKICQSYKRNFQISKQMSGGLVSYISNTYCDAIANAYDPHTSYLSLDEKENFESALGKKNYVFGFTIDDDEDKEGVTIKNIQPGSAAFKTGQINKEDKFLSIKWEGQEPIDVSKATASELSTILSNSNHANASMLFEKPDGSKVEVTLAKAISTNDEEEEKVSSYILNGSKKIGYIALPAFYDDWENDAKVNGCSNDVAKEILKLKKENIEGLVLDLRYNGGGSLYEAVDLAGLFIDAGPIAQIKGKETKVQTIKDINRGTVFDGPLIVLINGFSASASELVAGVLQDYNRALIVGSPSFGKATGQLVYPMDTTVEMEQMHNYKNNGAAIKITNLQIFQVSGKTAQLNGVIPDIVLPSTTDIYDKKEASEPFAIPSTMIAANKFYTKLTPIDIQSLKQKAKTFENEDNYFESLTKYIAVQKADKAIADREINLETTIKKYKSLANKNDETEDKIRTQNMYTVMANSQAIEREKTNKELSLINTFNTQRLIKDAYVQIAYKLLLQMK